VLTMVKKAWNWTPAAPVRNCHTMAPAETAEDERKAKVAACADVDGL
jgi:hypothetical protein